MKTSNFLLLLLFTVALYTFSTSYACAQKSNFTVVIDPGHGGKDAGACANRGKEKDINLAVAKEVSRLIKAQYPDVKVLMTRTTDVFIGLMDRARFANRNKADLFISIHTNSARARSANGTETFVLGLHRAEDNLQVAMRENESILLEKDYDVTYQGFDPNSTESYIIFEMMQNVHLDSSIAVATYIQNHFVKIGRGNRSVRQAGFLVIRETAMPAVLVELGFITNRQEARYLMSNNGRKKLARSIVRGFGEYYKHQMNIKGLSYNEVALDEPEPMVDNTVTSASTNSTYYRIQVATSKKKVSPKHRQFRGLVDVQCDKVGSYYVVTANECATLKEAKSTLKRLKKQRRFKDAFIVKYKQGRRGDYIY